MGRVFIIAELGSSPAPTWDFDAWCAAAAAVGADAIKAQCFQASHFPSGEQDSKRPLEFPRERLGEFVRCAHAYGLSAGVSVFDDEAAHLAQQWCDFVKLAAREQDNEALIEACYTKWPQPYGLRMQATLPVYRSISRLDLHPNTFLHNWTHLFAVQRYPAGMARSLAGVARAYEFFRRHGVRRWGYSSHTTGIFDCVFAAYLGVCVVEKHLALHSTDLEAGHSLQPEAFTRMVTAVRRVERKS